VNLIRGSGQETETVKTEFSDIHHIYNKYLHLYLHWTNLCTSVTSKASCCQTILEAPPYNMVITTINATLMPIKFTIWMR